MQPELAAVVFGISSAVSWGIGDFTGGFSSRRAPALTVVLISQFVGLSSLVIVAIASGEKYPSGEDIAWSAIAGIMGELGLLSLYRAMAIGQMSIAAPVTAVLGAGIPAVFGIFLQGLPGLLALPGFALALAGVWYISRVENMTVRRDGLGLAFFAGFCFGVFFIFISQIAEDVIFWPLAVSRVASVSGMIGYALMQRRFMWPSKAMLPLLVFAGLMDVGGNIFFVLAEQAGRLDIAAVLSSLYPATTVLLALVLLKERVSPAQRLGIVLALAAIPFIAAG